LQNRINVLFVQAQESFGADAAVHAQLMRYLDRDEFTVHALCPAPTSGTTSPALAELGRIPDLRMLTTHFAPSLARRRFPDVFDAARASLRASADLLTVRRYLKHERIHVVHGSDRPRSALYSVVLARLARAKSVVHMHVKWSPAYGRASTIGVEHADAIFGISRFVTESVLREHKPSDRVFTILNAIDLGRWDPRTDGSAVRTEFGIASDAPLLVSVSRLFPWKGQRDLLRALAIVVRVQPRVKLLIVGSDERYAHASSFTSELRAMAADLGIIEHVIFAGERHDIPAVMAAADVFTLPSFEEPFGLVYLEAMAMQRPVVALDNGGTPEVVEHGSTGLLSAAGDYAGLARDILRLLADPELCRGMGLRGRQRVIESFSSQRMATDAAHAYRTITAR
jgi:glycosyltransferase involved in cell wall biosynthesis